MRTILPAGPLEGLLQVLEGPDDYEADVGRLLERADQLLQEDATWDGSSPPVVPVMEEDELAPWEALRTALEERYSDRLDDFFDVWRQLVEEPRNLELLNEAYERYHEGGH